MSKKKPTPKKPTIRQRRSAHYKLVKNVNKENDDSFCALLTEEPLYGIPRRFMWKPNMNSTSEHLFNMVARNPSNPNAIGYSGYYKGEISGNAFAIATIVREILITHKLSIGNACPKRHSLPEDILERHEKKRLKETRAAGGLVVYDRCCTHYAWNLNPVDADWKARHGLMTISTAMCRGYLIELYVTETRGDTVHEECFLFHGSDHLELLGVLWELKAPYVNINDFVTHNP